MADASETPHVQQLEVSDQNIVRCRMVALYADANRLDAAALERIRDGDALPPGDNPCHIAELGRGVRCVFSIEQHPGGWARHLSISIGGHLPLPQFAEIIMQWFGFRGDVLSEDLVTWPEDCPIGRAINLLQFL